MGEKDALSSLTNVKFHEKARVTLDGPADI